MSKPQNIRRTIYAAGQDIPLGVFVAGIKTARANLDTEFSCGLHGDPYFSDPCTGREIVKQFRAGMHDRISQAIPYIKRGSVKPWPASRKHSPLYQLELYRDAQRLKGYGGFGKRLTTPEVRKRLGDHVHIYVNGRVMTCNDQDCEV